MTPSLSARWVDWEYGSYYLEEAAMSSTKDVAIRLKTEDDRAKKKAERGGGKKTPRQSVGHYAKQLHVTPQGPSKKL